ncbi:MAG: helix-turn-helix transcriptional regulator [Devosia sp.]
MKDLEQLIDIIYESALDDTKLFELMSDVSSRFDTPSVMYLLNSSKSSPGTIITTNICHYDWEKYTSYFYTKDPCVGKEALAPTDRVFTNLEFFEEFDPEKNEHINDYLRPFFGGRLVQAIVLDRAGDQVSLLVTGIREKQEDYWLTEIGSFMNSIRPHLQRSARLRRKRGAPTPDYGSPYNQLNLPVIRFCTKGRILFTNQCFEDCYSAIQNIVPIDFISHEVRLDQDSDVFRASRELRLRNKKTATYIAYSENGTPVRVTVLLITSNLHVAFFEISRQGRSKIDHNFSNFFGLSEAEISLCEVLSDGTRVFEAAAILGRAKSTLRNQLTSVFAKTGTSSQPELVSLLRLAESRDAKT